MNRKNDIIIAISGVGGAGKNSIMEVFKDHPERFSFFVSYTDKPKREDETRGETYHYISQEDFSKQIENNEFMEWEKVRGEYRYGRKKEDLDRIIQSGKIPVMQIDVKGAQKFRKDYEVISFFIIPPSMDEAIKRMRNRGTDTEEAIQHRINRYELELNHKNEYDHVIINDDLKKAQEEILKIVENKIKS